MNCFKKYDFDKKIVILNLFHHAELYIFFKKWGCFAIVRNFNSKNMYLYRYILNIYKPFFSKVKCFDKKHSLFRKA